MATRTRSEVIATTIMELRGGLSGALEAAAKRKASQDSTTVTPAGCSEQSPRREKRGVGADVVPQPVVSPCGRTSCRVGSCKLGHQSSRSASVRRPNAIARRQPAISKREAAALGRNLRKLRALLEAIQPADRRRCAIKGLSERLRRVLLFHMQAAPQEKPNLRKQAVEFATPVIPSRHLFSSVPSTDTECSRVCTSSTQLHEGKAAKAVRLVPTGCCRPLRGGVGAVSALKSGARRLYYARITIDGIAISSRCKQTFAEAERLRMMLASVRASRPPEQQKLLNWLADFFPASAPAAKEQAAATESQVSLHFQQPYTEQSQLRRDLRMEKWSFRVIASARAWTGKVLSSRRMETMAEALDVRDRLAAARQKGWSEFRDEWMRCSSTPGSSQSLAMWSAACRGQLLKRRRCAETNHKKAEASARRAERQIFESLAPRLERQVSRLCCFSGENTPVMREPVPANEIT